jgi:hypothetical protein
VRLEAVYIFFHVMLWDPQCEIGFFLNALRARDLWPLAVRLNILFLYVDALGLRTFVPSP